MAVYSSGTELVWREVEAGRLPSPRMGSQATLVNGVLFLVGGYSYYDYDEDEETDEVDLLSDILSWDPVSMSWQEAGRLAVPRADHAVVAVSHEVVAAYCQV